jgi:hypothetical protein
VFSTADPGQDFAHEALDFFTGTPKSRLQADEMDLNDEELDLGEIPDQPLGLLVGKPKYFPAAAGPSHSVISHTFVLLI